MTMTSEMVSADEARAMEHRSDGAGRSRGRDAHGVSALRYVRTVIVLHAIIEGRTVRRRTREIAAHEAGGSWLPAWQFDGEPRVDTARLLVQVATREGPCAVDVSMDRPRCHRWSPCAWPEVSRG